MTNMFQKLKKNRANNFDKLREELNKATGKQDFSDDRFWYPSVDKSGNGYAVVRFLPTPEADGEGKPPFVRVFEHSFQGPTGSWYIENSLTTLGRQDPVSEYNTKLWNSGRESDKDLARKYKRRLNFISNVYVVKDPSNPENDGKVFLFKYGKQIFDVLHEANNPEFEDETPIDPFDLWDNGADFKIKIRNKDGYRNYSSSEFEKAAPLSDDDSELEKIWKQAHSLQEFVNPKNFKSYEELKAKLERVLGLSEGGDTKSAADDEDSSPPWDTSDEVGAPTLKETSTPSYEEEDISTEFDADAELSMDEDEEDFFKKLANG